MFQSQEVAELGSFSHVVLGLELRIEERSYRIKAAEARHVSGVSLNGGLVEKQLHEAVNLKPGPPWRTQDIRGARVMGYLPRRTANRECNQPRRKKSVAVNKAEWN